MKKLTFLLSLLFLAFIALPAQAADPIADAVNGLKSSPVYVAGDANPTLSQNDANTLRDRIGSDPIYIAVIPDAHRNWDALPKAIGQGFGRPGVFAVVSGKHFRAGSSGTLGSGQAGSLATQAFENNSPAKTGSLTPMLMDFVNRTHAALANRSSGSGAGGGTASSAPVEKKSHAKEIILWILGILGGLVALVLGALGITRWQKRKAEEAKAHAEFEQAKRTANARRTVLNDDVLTFSGMANAKAKACYNDAVGALTRASQLIDTAVTKEDIDVANEDLNKAEASMSDAKSFAAGNDPVAERAAAAKAAAAQAEADRKARAAEEAERQKAEAAAAKERAKYEKKMDKYAPAERQSTTNNNYFGGGYYNGMYYGPGYYSDPFWNYLMMDSLLDHSQHDYDHGDHGDYDHGSHYDDNNTSNGGDWDYSSSSSSSSGGDWGSSDSSSGGGGFDFGGGGGSDYSSSSSDSGGSSGGGDW